MKTDKLALSSQYIGIWRNKLVLTSVYTNFVIIVDQETKEIEKIFSLPDILPGDTLFRYFTIHKNHVILVPYNAQDFLLVDLFTGEVTKIQGILNENEKNIEQKFLHGIKISKHLWCIGDKLHTIICLNLEHGFRKVYEYNGDDLKDILWSPTHITVNEMIYIPSFNQSKILEINNIKTTIKIHLLKNLEPNKGFLDIASINGEIHLFDDKGFEYVWNPQNDMVNYLDENELEENLFAGRQSFSYKNKFFRIALHENSVYVRSDKHQFQKIPFPVKRLNQEEKLTHFHDGCVLGQEIYLQARYGQIFKLDMETLEVEEVLIHDNKEILEAGVSVLKRIYSTRIINEGEEEGSLQDFIQDICTIGFV